MKQTCQTIINQIGGVARVRLMLGCDVMVDESTDSITLTNVKGSRKVNTIKISLVNDLYNVKMFKIQPKKFKIDVVGEFEQIYIEQLKQCIESNTGLYLSI